MKLWHALGLNHYLRLPWDKLLPQYSHKVHLGGRTRHLRCSLKECRCSHKEYRCSHRVYKCSLKVSGEIHVIIYFAASRPTCHHKHLKKNLPLMTVLDLTALLYFNRIILIPCSRNNGACLQSNRNRQQLHRKFKHKHLFRQSMMISSARHLCDIQPCLVSILTPVDFQVAQLLKNLLLLKRIKMWHSKQQLVNSHNLRISLSNSNLETSHLYIHLAWVEEIRTTIS